jgi:hypothetical protein
MPKREIARRQPRSKWSGSTSLAPRCLAAKMAKEIANSESFIHSRIILHNVILLNIRSSVPGMHSLGLSTAGIIKARYQDEDVARKRHERSYGRMTRYARIVA